MSEAEEKKLKISCHSCTQKLDVSSLEPFSRISCPVCGAELIVPKWFDNYLLEEAGGSGGMATVYRALDLALDREVAIKVLSPELSRDPARSELFLHEARTAATINHYAVVSIYTCGVFEGQSYIVMQYMGGGSLEAKLRKSLTPLPIETVLLWMRDVAEGLENARLHGIVHHDIKPGNILLDDEEHAKVSDFGIAQVITAAAKEKSDKDYSHSWITPNYVSPEKVLTNEEGFQGDIYSLGATFYHLLTGCPPFVHSDVDELIRMRLTETPMAPHLHRTDIDVELSQLIMSMLARNPMDRPEYKTIIGILNRILKERSAATVPLPVKTLRTKADPRLLQELSEKKTVSKKSGGSGSNLFFLFLLLLLLGAGGYFCWDQGYFGTTQTVAGSAINQDPNPEITYQFTLGNTIAAITFAEYAVNDAEKSAEQKVPALYQYAAALYLEKDPAAAAKLGNLLQTLEHDCQAVDLVKQDPVLIPIRFLADPNTEPDPETRSKADPALMSFADFLCTLRFGDDNAQNRLPGLLAQVKSDFANADSDLWYVRSWNDRLLLWEQIITSSTGIISQTEPLLAALIKREAAWKNQVHVYKIETPEHWMALNSETPEPEKTIVHPQSRQRPFAITVEGIQEAAEKYNKKNRPRPSAPAILSIDAVKDYLSRLSTEEQKSERRRLRIMSQNAEYLAVVSARHPYETESLSTLSGKTYKNGTVMFNPRFLSFKSDEGLNRIEWNQLSANEMMTIMQYYLLFRENAQKHIPAEHVEMKKELGMTYMRYALLCQWYGNYSEAEKYAKRTLELLPGEKTQRYITELLLR